MEKKRTIKDWIIAVRPWSFPASVTPIFVTTAYLFYLSYTSDLEMNWLNAVMSLFLLMFLHAGGNLVSDYYDHIKGVDKVNGPNGVTWIHDGLFEPKEILHYGYILLAIAAVLGIAILFNSSFTAIWLGFAGLFLASCYPWLKSHAMGDLDVLLGFALLPSVGESFVVSGDYHWETMLLSLTFGLITVAILHANNTRDIENDFGAGLTTMSIALGTKTCQYLYLALLTIPYILIAVFFAIGLIPIWSFLPYLTIPIAVKNCHQMMPAGGDEPHIASLDQQTAQLQMLFGILFTISFIIASFV